MLTRSFTAALVVGLAAPLAGAASLDDALDYTTLAAHPVGARITLDDVLVEDARLDLALERFEVLTADATVVVGVGPTARLLPRPDVVLLRGAVVGAPDSRVFLAVAPGATHGFVERTGRTQIVSTGPHGSRFGAMVGDARDLLADAPPVETICGNDGNPDWLDPHGRGEAIAVAGGGGAADGTPPCRVLRMAVDTDWEFTGNLFGGDVNASAAYALTLLGATTEIYRNDFNVRILVNFLRLYDTPDDPWIAGGSSAALNELRNWWVSEESGVSRDLVHQLCGRSLGGGVAWLDVVCDTEFGYAVSGNLNGTFPYPLQDHSGANWDIVVVAHETGHNCGTPHTHDFNPPIDGCGNGDCGGAFGGTIMSYCHTCGGGMSNIQLSFHPIVIDHVLADLDQGCDITATGAHAIDDQFRGYPNTPTVLDMLLNDESASCEDVVLTSFDATGSGGGLVELIPADAGHPRDRLRITPAGFAQEVVHYAIAGGETGTIRVIVDPLRSADVTGETEVGASVRYYALTEPQQLPDFDALEPYATDVVSNVNYPSTGGAFATSGASDQVGAVFTGFVTVPEPGLYTFYTNSDDGSSLRIGDALVVNNDGLHGMVERSGAIGLDAGAHRIRVEFFENFGGAGLIVSWQGPTFGKAVIPASAWSHPLSCGPDLDGSGVVGFEDMLVLLSSWGPCEACPADLDGSGAVDFVDLLQLLTAWGACAP